LLKRKRWGERIEKKRLERDWWCRKVFLGFFFLHKKNGVRVRGREGERVRG
jgi:hypothetical protein